jgi:dTDP-4-amino-4,6-dideoxygalactose transaminase
MAQKAAYLSGKEDAQLKQAYSQMYQACNRSFGNILPLRSMDEWSVSLLRHLDLEAIRSQRRKNAQVLVQSFQEEKGITPLFTTLKEQDCPLFVPIFASDARKIQRELAQKNIYCPMHWPRHCEEAESNLYETEVSLICDQRYDEEDMRCIVQALQK